MFYHVGPLEHHHENEMRLFLHNRLENELLDDMMSSVQIINDEESLSISGPTWDWPPYTHPLSGFNTMYKKDTQQVYHNHINRSESFSVKSTFY